MFNARSLNSKDRLLHLHALLYSQAFDIVLITETWLNNGTPSSLLDPDNRYNVIRCDRQHGQAGGVCAFVSKFLKVVEMPVTQHFPTLEICCFDVLFCRAKCRIFTAYRRPEYDCASVEYMTQLVACLTKFTSTKTPCIIAGDLNCPGVDWINSVSPSDNVQVKLMEFATANGFVQAVPEPTRLSNTLDIILTNEPAIICRVAVEAPFTSKCDHRSVNFCISLEGIGDGPSGSNEQSSPPTKVYLWKDADFEGMSNYLSQVRWLDMLAVNLTPNSIWHAFRSTINDAIETFVPVRLRPATANELRKKITYPRKIRRAISRKSCLWRKLKANPGDTKIESSYRNAETRCRSLMRNFELKRESEVILSNNIGSFYKFETSACRASEVSAP